jgi:hypothetical protein
LAAGDLGRFDVVVLWQGASQSPVLPAEERLLQAYVKGGGTLLVVGNGRVANQRLARALGFDFVPAATNPLLDYQHKAVWMLGECKRRYGDDFMARVLKLRDKKYGVRKPITLVQTFALFAEVSGDEKIYDWYRAIGLSVDRPTP